MQITMKPLDEIRPYLKTFYTVIFSPSCTKVGMMGDKHKRIHHMIDWDRCVPKILNEKWKKT